MFRTTPRRFLKVLHTLGAVGTLGALAACLVIAAKGAQEPLAAYAATRMAIAAIAKWLLVPSLLLVLTSGLLALISHRAYMNAGWAWVKALLGISMFEGTLLTVAATSRRAAELAALAVAGTPDSAALAEQLRTEHGGLWLLVALSTANIVLGVWRPKLSVRRA